MIVVFPVVWIHDPCVREVQSAFSQSARGMRRSEADVEMCAVLLLGNTFETNRRPDNWSRPPSRVRAEQQQHRTELSAKCVFKGSGNQCHTCAERVILARCCLRTTDVCTTSGCSKALGRPGHADSRGAACAARVRKYRKRYQHWVHKHILSCPVASYVSPA